LAAFRFEVFGLDFLVDVAGNALLLEVRTQLTGPSSLELGIVAWPRCLLVVVAALRRGLVGIAV